MAKLDTRFSIVDVINISLLMTVYYLLALTMGSEPIMIAVLIMVLSGLIYVLVSIFLLKSINKQDIIERLNVTAVSSDDQSVTRFKDSSFWFLVLLVVLFVVVIPSFLFIIFGFGSVFIADITITVVVIVNVVIKFKIPWPSRMTKRNLGFEIDDKTSS